MSDAIRIDGVRVRYDEHGGDILDIEALSVPYGQRLAIIGTSGAGKTTLLRLINGLITPQTGRVEVLGVALGSAEARQREFRRRVGCIFQEYNLVERSSAYRNALCGRLGWAGPVASLLGLFSDTDRALAHKALTETGLENLAHRRADSLSGGQRQRVAIARALTQDPTLLCADEPVSNLDPVLAEEMLALIADSGAQRGLTTVMIVHQPALAKKHAERIIGLAVGRIAYDSAADGPLDAVTLRRIYGRSPAPEPVPAPIGENQRISA
jgi:phosphonate transport system ATP-binding protein